ncbi:ROK family protein [Curtobacterium sp. MCPF17_002]|uniref:ROK family protein n=1 Tax=Curtobacterium sp. MCPF17_002 TaxID=2175645 RepID=UPI000DAA4404|nr:ROK family protein [Curtobacterium sp. MCPF17_002]WIB77412.1 ROK family protein [Curtobacterium sp. MCPF17_002]
MSRAGAVLGVDVGGTGIKARRTDADGLVLDETRVPTPRDDPDATRLAVVVADLAEAALARGPLDAIGLVTPGVVDESAGRVVLAVNLGWQDVPVRDTVRDELARRGLHVPVAFGHDVRAGALAETAGASRAEPAGAAPALGRGSVAFVPVGTGLASALVVDGAVVSGDGWAGEIGQVRIPSGPHAGLRVEEIASAGGVARRSGSVSAHDAMLRVRAGDPVAARVWDECVTVLADALVWTTAVAGCHTIIVGGGLAQSGPLLFDPLTAAVADRLVGLRVPAIVPARHGDAAGAIGAGLLARAALDTSRDEVPA